ncbi:MAG: substrate-binding domain-containing protein [Opitutaceae bacterium]|nr:substrate-binding domain-containing protein [Opitutaceae bacterium]
MPLPSERAMGRAWNINHVSVNRACIGLVANGRLRRSGYKLYVNQADGWTPPECQVLLVARHWLKRGELRQSLKIAATARNVSYRFDSSVSHERVNEVLREGVSRSEAIILHVSPVQPYEPGFKDAILQRRLPCVSLGHTPLPVDQIRVNPLVSCELVLSHLFSLGHQRVAMLIYDEENIENDAWVAAWRQALVSAGRSAASGPLINATHRHLSPERILEHVRRHDNGSTAIFCRADYSAIALQEAIAHANIPPDKSYALVGYPDCRGMREARVPISSVDIDLNAQMDLAVDLLIRQWRMASKPNRPRRPLTLDFDPRLEIRESTTHKASGGILAAEARVPDRPEPSDPTVGERIARIRTINAERHPGLPGSRHPGWRAVDLRGLVNKSVTTNHSWLGEQPLLHFHAGQCVVHGVPFEVVEVGHQRKMALVLRSLKSRTTGRAALPDRVRIPVGQHLSRLFLLLGCGWSEPGALVATFQFIFADGSTASLPVICAGDTLKPPRKANIQDWWPTYPVLAAKGALPFAVVGEDGDPHNYERYLYTLEWRNPKRHLAIQEVVAESQPHRDPTLGILALTALA